MSSNETSKPKHRGEFDREKELAMLAEANRKSFVGNIWAGVIGGLISTPMIAAAVAIYNEFVRSTRGHYEIILLSILAILVSVGPLFYVTVEYTKSKSNATKWTTAAGILIFAVASIIVFFGVFKYPDIVFPQE